MKKICFVCTGNTCRSPVAEKLFNKYLKQHKISDFKVCSYGLDADPKQDMSENSKLVLKKYKINVKKRMAKKITKSALKNVDLFITMTSQHKKAFPPNVKVFTFGEFVGGDDILDPYGQDYMAYEQMAAQVDDYCKLLINKILTLKGDNP